jgi:ubiquinone/menaquinone biosynthesis C-methylase UbiE
MGGYYDDRLAAARLRKVYEIASPRVRRYLEAEMRHVMQYIGAGSRVLELGCGYGRILPSLPRNTDLVVGIDTSLSSLLLAQDLLRADSRFLLAQADAAELPFGDQTFDRVLCIQNGISAFHVDQRRLVRESARVTLPGGYILFSSYARKFWRPRLEWFELQSAAGLLGEIDYEKTGEGVIVCKDGFRATTLGPEEFRELTRELGADTRVVEVDESSLFCEIRLSHD